MSAAAEKMPLSAHLQEARKRAVRAAVALIIGTVTGYLTSDFVMDVLRAPITELAESRSASLNYDSVTGAFDLQLRIAVYSGIVLSSPVWLGEAFGFLTPGLTAKEKKYTFGFLGAALPLFVVGCLTGLYIFPRMVEVLTSFASSEDSTFLQASYYFDFVFKIVIATGVAFVLPVFLVVLNFIGLLSARSIAKAWRVAIVVFAALITPAADVLSMFFVAAPMALLFLAALVIAFIHDRARGYDRMVGGPHAEEERSGRVPITPTERTRTCSA
ncbi:sec-independent protein translocase protein TatC [Brevibacterium iodinum ATCC 49514]|uniref:Sec-independent protein translocase protein TatC n=1 Tax=Brevibacterium iodinum ATCC 49514 TaxID=1255616 RepID=A0A2H1KIW7_9MICO|nr:twin-arginine translocase subunit TatC [Brevibacterium iodinum]SMX99162.1 sec-independent protein translocase protein TatC [Brevibacterium iodinum ATCC 49514]SUW11584.1 Sec-independent protein translocase protein TatCy [Brevibacterium iodinum]